MPVALPRSCGFEVSPTSGARAGRQSARPSADAGVSAARAPLGFVLFIALTGVLFIRPAEIVPALLGLPIYEVLILVCAVVSLPAVLEQLQWKNLAARPINLLVLAMLPAVVLSRASHFQIGLAWSEGLEFAKVVVYYLLFIGLLTTIARLRSFLLWLTAFVFVLAVIALLQYHGVISIASLEAFEQAVDDECGERSILPRLCSTGIYHDPNDLCLILVVGMSIALYWMGERRTGPVRFFWAAPLIVFGYALLLTRSRGGPGLLGRARGPLPGTVRLEESPPPGRGRPAGHDSAIRRQVHKRRPLQPRGYRAGPHPAVEGRAGVVEGGSRVRHRQGAVPSSTWSARRRSVSRPGSRAALSSTGSWARTIRSPVRSYTPSG
jgi:hypothetical protein